MELSKKHKALSVFSLTMMNVIAVDSLRNLAVSAEYGLALVFFYAVAALMFYIPCVLVAAELATGWPQTGGAYIWVREAFGRRWGFLAIWLQWGYNVVWYPTILSFISGTLAYLINPKLASNSFYMWGMVISIYWAVTLINCLGIRTSSRVSVWGAMMGTLLPMFLIVGLGAFWLFSGRPLQIDITLRNFLPTSHSFANLAFLISLIFSLMGMEMSAIHAGEVDKPEKNYPRALAYSSLIIWFSLVLSSLSIALVIPRHELNFVSGLVDAFSMFFQSYHLNWLLPIVILSIVIGCMSEVSTWVIGPTRGLLIAAKESSVMRRLHHVNGKGAPVGILLFQASIFTVLSTVFLLMPTVNSSYWILTALTSQVALLYYSLVFAAAIRLRYTSPMVARAFQIPGGKPGMWIAVTLGITSCFTAIFLGFQPPAQLHIGNVFYYEAFLLGGLTMFCGMPMLLINRAKRRQAKENAAAA